ncbi:rifin [Plasmodium reichenowi]|uniref:Rifin n=1 Tax=Plasmodium reichenowi TaxID=5854 RepID=A0A060RME1_PLARE|nr:rifin [Plasmodium reichenowi]
MKVHYTKILLLAPALNILLTSLSNAHNKNKLYIAPHHTSTTKSRVLSKCDIRSSIYDNDTDIKSVKEIFDRQTSQRFEEYEELMKEKRRKSKEQRNKNIQEIIDKDKMEKSLGEKIEKGCLRCGCGLGGVAASVGIFGTIAVKELAKSATAAAVASAQEAAMTAGEAARVLAGKNAVIAGIIKQFRVSTLGVQELETLFTANNYNNVKNIANAINNQYSVSSCPFNSARTREPFCSWVMEKFSSRVNGASAYKSIETTVGTIVSDAEPVAAAAAKKATDEVIQRSTAVVQAKYASCQTAIIASVVAILIIVLVMIIIYLVLRYRRKKKMNFWL